MAKKPAAKPPEETKKPSKKTEKPAALVSLSVSAPAGRRFRAGVEFGPVARTVEVSPERAAAIRADRALKVEG